MSKCPLSEVARICDEVIASEGKSFDSAVKTKSDVGFGWGRGELALAKKIREAIHCRGCGAQNVPLNTRRVCEDCEYPTHHTNDCGIREGGYCNCPVENPELRK